MVTQLDRPPDLILEAWAIETRQRARSNANLPVIHNVRPGQLATALERGFLPLALKDYESAIEASEERKNLGKRGKQAGSRKTQPKKANNKQTSLEIGGS